jgi:nickel and cobalt resistance protein CnrR
LTSIPRLAFAVVFVTAVAAAAGGWAGIRYALNEQHSRVGLDEIVHRELNLSADQNQRIEALESTFAARRAVLEQEMRAANRDLAAAIAVEHVFGPRAQSGIERFHRAESALEEETVKHVLAMRTVLTREQMRRFDEAISNSLTSD